LELLGGQVDLLDAVAATGKPFVVVLIASKPLVLPPSVSAASAVIWAANPGMAGGQAIAELVLGAIEPTGRLPISFARHVGQQPTYYNQIRGQHGHRYADLTQEPAYPFGYGLSYSTVTYSDLTITDPVVTVNGELHATVTVTNTGTRPVLETVQAYISDLVTSASWADLELKGYEQVSLAPGEKRQVKLTLPVSTFTIVNSAQKRVVEPGEFELLVGPNSRRENLLAARFAVRG